MGALCPGGSPELLAAGIVIGLSNGALIALVAIGYTLVYGIIELINFSHGDLFMLGTFVALTVLTFFGFTQDTTTTPWLALLAALVAAMVFCGILNMLAERIAYRRLRNAPKLAPLISAIGVSFIYINLGQFFGLSAVRFPELLPQFDLLESFTGAGSLIRITSRDAFVVGMAVPLMLALAWLIKSTKLGRAMRAVAQDREMALQMGVDVDRVIAFTFLLGGLLAGAAALMHGLYNGNTVFTLGFTAGLKAFTAAVLGGIGNVTGAALGGLLIGLLGAMTITCYGGEWENVGVFSVLVLILVFRPTGLLGEQTPDR